MRKNEYQNWKVAKSEEAYLENRNIPINEWEVRDNRETCDER